MAPSEAGRLRDLPAAQLLDIQTRVTPRSAGVAYGPVADGTDIPVGSRGGHRRRECRRDPTRGGDAPLGVLVFRRMDGAGGLPVRRDTARSAR